jgi:hypothetical protein
MYIAEKIAYIFQNRLVDTMCPIQFVKQNLNSIRSYEVEQRIFFSLNTQNH